MLSNLPLELLTVQNLNRVACRVFNKQGLLSLGMIPDEAVLYDAISERLTDTGLTREHRRLPCPQDSLRWIVRDAYELFYGSGGNRDAPVVLQPHLFSEAAELLVCWTDFPDTVSYADLRKQYILLTETSRPERFDPLIDMLYVVCIHHKDNKFQLQLPRQRAWQDPTFGVVSTMYQGVVMLDQMYGRQMTMTQAGQTVTVQLSLLRCALYRLLAGYLP